MRDEVILAIKNYFKNNDSKQIIVLTDLATYNQILVESRECDTRSINQRRGYYKLYNVPIECDCRIKGHYKIMAKADYEKMKIEELKQDFYDKWIKEEL